MSANPATSPNLEQELEASLREIGIPPRPRLLEQISREARAEDPDFNYLAALIGRDVGLSAGLIKTANSPFYGFQRKTRSVREALLMLGLQAAANTVAGLILRRIFPPLAHLERFWDASDHTAQISGWLVQQLGVRFGVRAEDAYTYGLFRDCGIPIMMRRFDGYHRILARANDSDTHSFTEVEQAEVPTNHAMVGGMMAQSWWLPEMTCTAIRLHHDIHVINVTPEDLPGASLRLIALAQTAEKLLQDMTHLNRTREWDKLGVACLATLEMDEADLTRLGPEAKAFIDSLPAF